MQKSTLIALICALFTMFWALNTADNTFESLPHLEDEYAYTYQAKIFAEGDVYIETPEYRRAFWQPFLIDLDGKRFSKYPPGWSLLLSVGYNLGFPNVINAWFGMLSVITTYQLAREIFDAQTGAIAAALLTMSPIATIQNATYMSHTSALFFTMLFLYGMWRLEKNSYPWRWGIVAGISLGMIIGIRPLVAVSIGLPLVAYSGFRLLWALLPRYPKVHQWPWWVRVLLTWLPIVGVAIASYVVLDFLTDWDLAFIILMAMAVMSYSLYLIVFDKETPINPSLPTQFNSTLLPLLLVATFTMIIGSQYPIYNTIVADDPQANLYTYIWEYDTIGIGNGHGRPRFIEPDDPMPAGQKISLAEYHNWRQARRNLADDTQCYARDLFGWVAQPDSPPNFLVPPYSEDLCAVDQAGFSWIFLPLGLIIGWRYRWFHVLGLAAVGIFAGTLFYWIGASTYSARYYYEATAILAIISAIGIRQIAVWLQDLQLSAVVYVLIFVIGLQMLFGYIPQRLEPLENTFTNNARNQMANAERWRWQQDKPLLIIAYGDIHWRDINALMAQTSPYRDSDIILARDPEANTFIELAALFPNYQVIYYVNGQFQPSLIG